MKAFPDTSFLCSIYREQAFSREADKLFEETDKPLAVSALLLFEFRQSVRLQIFLHTKDRKKGFTKEEGEAMLRDLRADLASGVIAVVPVDWTEVHKLAEILSAKHTESGGHRFADLLHIATALQLGAENFLTFDANQRAIARAEGMKTPG
ncbi:MAG: type II toxin-antitoxin system VapC family toxin [Chthoniobacterales bacterium]